MDVKSGLQKYAAEVNQEQQELRAVNQIRQEAERRLAQMNLAPMDPVMANKMAPGTLAASQVQVSTNIFGLQMATQKNVFRYQIKIVGELLPRAEEKEQRIRQLEFTGQVRGDPNCVTRRDDCRKIFSKLLVTNKKDFSEKNSFYFYDLKAILFTLTPLNIQDKKDFEISTSTDFYPYLQKIVLTVQKVKEKYQLTTGELAAYVNPDLSQTDRSLQQFLEIAISQPVLNDPANHVVINGGATYFMDPIAFGFSDRDTPAMKEGKYLAIGAQKSVRFVEGPRGRNFKNAAAVVEPKKTPFHEQQPLIEKLQSMTRMGPGGRVNTYDMEAIRRGVKGLYVHTTHRSSNRIMKIQDLLNETARTSKLNANESYGAVTIEKYFQDRYNMRLKYPEAPLIGIRDQKTPGSLLKFPAEVLQVVDNQRVTTEQQSREQISQQIRACAVLPSVLKDQIAKSATAIGLFKNEYLSSAGVNVVSNPLQCTARMLPPPTVYYGNKSTALPDNRGTWRGDVRAHFLLPAKCNKWVAFLINPNARDAIDERTMNDLINRLVGECAKRGMLMGKPFKVGVVAATEEEMSVMLDNCVRNGVEFAFFVHAGNDTTIHGFMKYFELKGIVTQDLKAQTAMNIVQKNQNLTMENIVMKTNVKLGGLNWSIKLDNPALNKMLDPAVLYIGFGTNHPGGGLGVAGTEAPPTVVGFAANDNPHPFEFTGDYVFQEIRRDEKVDVMKDIVEKILDRYIKNRGTTPKCLVFYRNGCSEGQFGDVIMYEIPFIKAAMKSKGCEAKLVVLVPNKLHNVRIVPANINRNEKAPEQNVKPGLVVDSNVVHPTWNEFYLCSHTTLQGTAKVPRYTVLYDDSGLSADQLQEATYAMAYGYQIVKSPTSLPAPAYIANKYADRGRTMYKAHVTSETLPANRRFKTNEELNNGITLVKFDALRGKRINA